MVNVTKGILVECDPAMKQVLLSIHRDFNSIGYISVSSASWWEVHSWLKIYHPGDKFYFLSIAKKHLFSGSWRDPLVHLSRRAGATKSSDRWLDGQDIGAHCWGCGEEVKLGIGTFYSLEISKLFWGWLQKVNCAEMIRRTPTRIELRIEDISE